MRLSSSCTARRDAAEPPDAHDRGAHIGAGAPSLTLRVGMRLAVELSPSRRRGGREASQWSCSEATRIVQNGHRSLPGCGVTLMSQQTTCAPSTARRVQSPGHCLRIWRSLGRCAQDDATRSMLASELHDQERCTKPRGARWLRRYVPNLSPVPTSSRRERRSGYYGRPAAPSASRRGRAASSAAVSGEDGLASTAGA